MVYHETLLKQRNFLGKVWMYEMLIYNNRYIHEINY